MAARELWHIGDADEVIVDDQEEEEEKSDAGGDLRCPCKGEDLDDNDSGVKVQVTWTVTLKNAKLKV